MLKNLKRAAAIVLSFAMAIQFGLANSYYVNAEEEPVEPQQEQTTTVENNSEVQEEDANEVAVPETKSVELSYVAEDGTVLQAATYRDFDLNYGLNTDSSVMLNFDGYTLKDVIVNNSQAVSADQASLSVTSDLASVQFVYKKVITETENQTTEPAKTEEKNEDDAEADPEVKEELVEYPAFDQSEMAGDVVVHATAAEGVLPRDSKLVVKRITRKAILNAVEDTVSEKNKEMDSAVALDITIQNKDGVEIQPNGSVNISFENAAVSGDEINVYHVTDDASAVTEVATNTQSFDANHFSIYVITGEKNVPLTTFNFVDAKGQIVSTQIVKTGDTLITPTAPDVAGKVFVGWYDGETKFEGFNTALTITETTTREITAKYEDALYVYFYNPDGTQIMRTEKVGNHEAHDFTTVSYEVDSTHKLVGWAAKKNGTENIADKISVPTDKTSVNVYAIIKEGYWVSFNSDGGSIVNSQFVLHGDKLVLGKDTTPTKPGYSFDGWYNGLTKVENGATVTSSMNLTAHWKAAKVNYTINYWQQKVTDDKNAADTQKTYEYVEAVTKKATTGTRVSATNSKTYKGFKYNANNSSKDVEISGDGTTIINVYYDRVLCTVNFHVDKGGYLWSDWQITKTVIGLYGANLPEGAWDSSSYWTVEKGGGTGCILLTSFDFETAGYADNQGNITTNGVVTTCNFYRQGKSGSASVHYYNEQADGSYKLVQTIKTGGGTLNVHEKYAGYDLYKYTTAKNPGTSSSYWEKQEDVYDGKRLDDYPVSIASKLKTYSLSYYNYNSVTKTEKNIKYTASLKSYENYTPARPSELPNYYLFGGWYKDKACTTKFDFNTEKMPNANLQIYAKWTAKKINLTYNLNTPDGTSKKVNGDVDAGTIASTVLPSASVIEGYSFAGWYYADGNGNITKDAFNANDAILKDTNVIGKWLYNGKLTVVYNPGTEESKATVPTDSNIYAGGAKVTVAKNATTTSNKKFLGWKLKGNLYYPGDAFEVNKDLANDDNVITLTAVWGSEEHSTTMSYNPGNGRGSVKKVTVKNNESVTLKSETSLGYQAPEAEGKEYYFAGWATSMEDANNGKATYAAGQTVHVDVNGENVLYATWIEKRVITVKAKSGTATYTGKEHKVEGFEATEFTVDGNKYTVEGLTASGATGTDAGNYTSKVTGKAVVKDAADNNVTKQFTVKTENGSLVISKATVTLKSADLNKEYDGKALVNGKTALAKEEGWAEGEGATYAFTGSQTVVGSSANAFSYTLKDGTKADNYTISKTEGTLTVKDRATKYEITVKAKSGTATYTGKEHKVEGFEATEFTVDGNKYTVEGLTASGATGTDAGNYTSKVTGKAVVKDAADNNVTKQFTVKTENGSLVINRKKYTVETLDGNKTYDGTPLTAGAKINGIIAGEVVEIKTTKSLTDVGNILNDKYELTWKTAKATNYKLDGEKFGTLTVTTQSIDPGTDPENPNPDYTGAKVNSPKDEVYDGKEHKWIPTVTDKADKKLEAGKDYTVEYSTKNFKDVGTIDVTITGIGNYSGTVKRSYKVTPKEYTVTTDSATKIYSGTALTAGGKVEGIVSGETVEFTTTGSQTEVGTSKNTYELVWKSAKATNYTLAKESIGKLTVKAKSIVPDDKDTPESDKTGITVSEPSDSKYDGKEHKEVLTVTDTKTGKELVAGTDYSVTYSSDLVNAGTVKVTVAGLGNYTGSFTKTYKITKRSVTLTSATVSKVYDGSALTNTSITVSGDGFVEGEGASYEVTGSQTEVGNSANAFEYKLNEKTLASNYNITKVVGTLTITAAPAPVTPATPSTPSTPSSTTSTTPRTPSAPQVTTPAETVEKETTPKAEPKKEEKVEEEYTPKASPQYYWALINLICAIVTVLFGLLLLISKRHKDEDDEEEDDETKQQATTNEDEEQEQEKKRGLFTRVLAVLIAIVSVVFFLVTEDMSLAWTWTDQWTIWMVVIGLVQIVVFFVGRKWKNVDNDDDDEEAQQA